VDGFGVIAALQGEHVPLTIFVTAYDKYAMKAFEVHALDYLLKPVGKDRLSEALGHARKQLSHPSEATFQRKLLDLLADLESRQQAPQRIVIKADGEIVCLKPNEIDWAESAGNYVCLHVGPNTHILRETITSLESRLGQRQFLRVHRVHTGECGPHQGLAALVVWRLFHSAARWHQAHAEPGLPRECAEAAGDSIAVAVPAYTGCGKSRLYLALKGRTFRACPEPAEGCAVVILL
jgi:hypothetical protein